MLNEPDDDYEDADDDSRRISLTRLGEPMVSKGMIAFAWFIWDKQHKGEPTIDWI